ncbi:dihydrofolate reductase [Chromobacterium violaceum]|uniref:Dihydrofolate reductase n=2 Tax=Chromobacterium violaceum TaxID=536 RepID=Q7NZ94_CHRVO|nr:dihydrofolate reductase [Chromobacterium violaceum]AAQ58703.1 dihydrofolate reductase [Chromobacterium violaceum ATCC 12472]KJH67996.1 diacylglycerol kinase [Chromobacterium violaceum]KMN49907.1 diacylglycerol kinase [Chromobacterium violaceum]KMN84886.1 diacylglycerol kinase [Chromobacterium violaceum]KMN90270.1 diacylglycerol kinase [Chromobacterium violaceum]
MSEAKKPTLTLVAAMAANRTIGVDNKLPWHLPEDLKHFKAATLGKPVIMGRKTWDSIGRPLPGRRNIVVTRQAAWRADGAETAHSLQEALALAGAVEEACLIGGADLYRQAMALADRLCLTEIARDYDGDAHFPAFAADEWREVSREQAVSAAGLPYAFVEYRRR